MVPVRGDTAREPLTTHGHDDGSQPGPERRGASLVRQLQRIRVRAIARKSPRFAMNQNVLLRTVTFAHKSEHVRRLPATCRRSCARVRTISPDDGSLRFRVEGVAVVSMECIEEVQWVTYKEARSDLPHRPSCPSQEFHGD